MASGLERLVNIFRGNFTAWLDSHEDPIVTLTQDIADAKDEYADLKVKWAEASAAARADAKRVEKAKQEIDTYNRIAEKAVTAGNDDDARRALQNVEQQEQMLETLQQTANASAETVNKMQLQMAKYGESIKQSEAVLEQLKAKMALADAKNASADFGSIDFGSHKDVLDRAVSKVDAALAKADAKEELAEGNDLAQDADLKEKYADGNVDDRLAALKAKLGK